MAVVAHDGAKTFSVIQGHRRTGPYLYIYTCVYNISQGSIDMAFRLKLKSLKAG